jgi:N-acetylmuramoyl-L-alanine amidase
LAGKTIVIDPGHGGTDSGEVAAGVAEKNVTPLYAGLLAQKLQALGAKVVFTRPLEDDPRLGSGGPELQRRARLADAAHADIVVRLHANASPGGGTSANGMEAWWDQPKDLALTRSIHDAVAQADRQLGVKDNGIKQRTQFFKDHYKFQPQAPSALIEVAYLSNASDRAKLLDRNVQNATADAIAQGVVNYFAQRR